MHSKKNTSSKESSTLGVCLTLLLAALLMTAQLVRADVAPAQRDALVELYNATNGTSWTNNTNWLAGAGTECTWFGVTCAADDVIEINLLDNGLVGTIPAQLSQLSELESLRLGRNQLTGNIPAELGLLSKLLRLHLFTNQLSGPIPAVLGQLSNLLELFLGGNQLSGAIPPELGQLSQLSGLVLYGNQLSGSVPSELGELDNLRVLYLYNNQLSGSIPASLGQLGNLTQLLMHQNQLSGSIPESLAQLNNLEQLTVQQNQLSGSIPAALAQLNNLTVLDLSNNNFTGYLPAFNESVAVTTDGNSLFSRTTALSASEKAALLALYNATGGVNWVDNSGWLGADGTECSWYGVVCDGVGVVEINLYGNDLAGTIPSSLSQLSALRYLRLYDNKLTGSIPAELGQLSNLVGLFLFKNQLSGSIPATLGQLSNLTRLYLQQNLLSGSIPSSLGQLSNLLQLYLFENQLSGSIPVTLGQLSNLTHIGFRENQLSGSIPAELGQLSSLTTLILSSNLLTGNIPAELGQLSNLKSLFLVDNQLSGSIPIELGQLSNLIELTLTDNQLSGSIPTALTQLNNLTILDLANNNLTGYLPAFSGSVAVNVDGNSLYSSTTALSANEKAVLLALYDAAGGANWTNNSGWLGADGTQCSWYGISCNTEGVAEINLIANGLVGTIPSSLSQLSELTTLRLHNNQLTGNIPTELGQLTNLNTLSLYNNQLSGTLPAELGQLSNLNSLLLSQNQLSGSIPVSLGQLSNLSQLYLQQNQFSGTIPTELGQLSNLTRLLLNQNQLSGSIPTELGQLSNLVILYLHENELSGAIPASLGQLTNLVQLFIHENQLSGSIPTSLGQLNKMTHLVLSVNSLTGEIPAEFGQLSSLIKLFSKDNQLTGSIPAELAQLSNLTELYLSGNQLSGSVPAALYKLDSLAVLDVAGNNLSQSSVVIEFAYTFDASRSGTVGHVLQGVLDGIILDDDDTFEVVGLEQASLAGVNYAIGETPGLRSAQFGVAPVLSLSGEYLDFWACPAGFTSDALDDCSFGSEGGFLISENWEALGGTGAVHAGHPNVVLDTGTRDSDRPINLSNWVTRVRSEQRATLITLYEATDGESWTNNNGWLDVATSECDWYGVTCSDGAVVGIDLGANQLSGNVPPALYELASLINLNLSGNTLSGVTIGTQAACTELSSVSVGDVLNGNLGNLNDCFLTSTGRLVDFLSLTLEQNTVLDFQLISPDFHPWIFVAERGGDTAETILGPVNSLRFNTTGEQIDGQVVLPAGEYVVTVRGFEYDPSNPPTGNYTLSIGESSEAQAHCMLPTYIIAGGPSVGATISTEDCVLSAREDLTDSETPRYYDGYEVLAQAGNSFNLSIAADFDYRLEHWVTSRGVTSSVAVGPTVSAGQTRVFGVTTVEGANQFYVVAVNPGETGNYFLAMGNYFEDQRDALFSLYNVTGGANWSDSSGWLGEAGTECSWFGITCTGAIVTGIALSDNNLNGTIPSDLRFLVDLATLDLSDNLLSGKVPSAIYRMGALESLNVTGNGLAQTSVLIDFSYTFDASRTGTTGHVLEGTLSGVMLDDSDSFEVVSIVEASLAGFDYALAETPGLRSSRLGVAPVLSLSGKYLDLWVCPAGFTNSELDDCSFGAEGGFLISEKWVAFDGVGAVHAGIPDLSASFRDSDRPINRSNWVANIRVVVPDAPTTPPIQNPTTTIDDLELSLNDIVVVEGETVTAETSNRVSDALANGKTLAEQVVNSLPEGSAGVDLALSALNTLDKTLTVTGSVQQQGGQVTSTAVVSSLGNVANVFNAMSSREGTLTTTQKQNVQKITDSTVGNSANMIRTTSTNAELIDLVAAASAVINAAASAGAELTPELATKTEQLVTKAIKTGIASFSAGMNTDDPVLVENLLRTNPDALEFAVAASVAVTSRIKADSNAISTELSNRGVSASVSAGLTTVLDAVANTNGVTVGGVSATDALLSALSQFLAGGAITSQQAGLVVQALSSNGVQIDVDPLTGSLIISTPNELYYGAAVSIRMVSNSMPKGISYMRDGRALVVGDGLAIEIAPTPSDIVGFTAAVQGAGYGLRLRKNGSLEIALGNGEFFSGALAYDNLSGFSAACGAISFIEPQGALNSAQYAFELKCANGATQRVTPFVHDSKFFTAVANSGAKLSTDRNTGVLSIQGIGRFKAGFFVSPLTPQEKTYLAANATSDGVAIQTMDVNGDGINDMVFMSAVGAQTLYGMAP